MKPYGYKKRSSCLHGKECLICKPDLDKKQGRRKARESAKKEIKPDS